MGEKPDRLPAVRIAQHFFFCDDIGHFRSPPPSPLSAAAERAEFPEHRVKELSISFRLRIRKRIQNALNEEVKKARQGH